MRPQTPTTYELDGPRFIHPSWFRVVEHGYHRCNVGDDGKVDLMGEKLAFSKLRQTLPPGTAVVVSLVGGFFRCCELDKWQKYEADLQSARRAREDAHRQQLNAWRDEALALNARLKLPVKWEAGQKDVLSGLTELRGDGRNQRSATHILLLERLASGRLVREPSDFLCTSTSGSNGKRWASTKAQSFDGDGRPYPSKITCQKCLELAKRWTQDG